MSFNEEAIIGEQYFRVTNMDRDKAERIKEKYLLIKEIRNPKKGLHYEFVEGHITFYPDISNDNLKFYKFCGSLSEKENKGPNEFFNAIIEESGSNFLIRNYLERKEDYKKDKEYHTYESIILLNFADSKYSEARIVNINDIDFLIKEKTRIKKTNGIY